MRMNKHINPTNLMRLGIVLAFCSAGFALAALLSGCSYDKEQSLERTRLNCQSTVVPVLNRHGETYACETP